MFKVNNRLCYCRYLICCTIVERAFNKLAIKYRKARDKKHDRLNLL